MWFREKEKDNETDLSSLLSSATGDNIEASASIEFDQDRLKLVSEIPTQILEKIMNISPAGKIAYRSLDMAIMKAMSEGNPEFKKMKNETVRKKNHGGNSGNLFYSLCSWLKQFFSFNVSFLRIFLLDKSPLTSIK